MTTQIFTLSPRTLAAIRGLRWERAPMPPAPPFATRSWRPWHYRVFGGSPIPLRLDRWEPLSHARFFLGPSFVDTDAETLRPDVDVVINLSEMDDRYPILPDDRRWVRGEGVFGYTWTRLEKDARDVAALLRADKRVLIHCTAGVNRSATLTCATLMVVEGLGATEALARIYRFHRPAHPEDSHWLALRQMEIALADLRAQGVAV